MLEESIASVNQKPVSVTLETFRHLIKKPMLALPSELREAALVTWTMHRYLHGMESPLSMSIAISYWINSCGLSIEDAKAILKKLNDPARMKDHKFASDLMADLACLVDRAISDAKSREYLRQRREEDERRAAEIEEDKRRTMRENNLNTEEEYREYQRKIAKEMLAQLGSLNSSYNPSKHSAR